MAGNDTKIEMGKKRCRRRLVLVLVLAPVAALSMFVAFSVGTSSYDVSVGYGFRVFKAGRGQTTLCSDADGVVIGSEITRIGRGPSFVVGEVIANPRVSNIAEEMSGFFFVDRTTGEVSRGLSRPEAAAKVSAHGSRMPQLVSPDLWAITH